MISFVFWPFEGGFRRRGRAHAGPGLSRRGGRGKQAASRRSGVSLRLGGPVLKTLFASAAALVLLSASSVYAAEARTERKAELMEPDPSAPANIGRMSQGRTYFNLPGADRALHDREVKACTEAADRARSVDAIIGNDQGLIPAMLSMGPKKGVYGAAVENCMVVKGWRVVMLPVAEGDALAARTPAEIAAAIEPWIGAETPPHVIVRTWKNDAAHASTTRYEMRPNFIDQGSLSLVAASNSREGRISYVAGGVWPQRVKLDKKWPKKPLKPEQIATAPVGSAIVLLHIKGVSFRSGVALTFSREWTYASGRPAAQDMAPDEILLAQGLLGAKPEGKLIAMAVPPGRWRLSSMGLLPAVSFCLGSPSFEVAAGDVIFAGSFDMSAEDITPDLDLGLAKTFLAGLPAADRVKPAVYTNGSVSACGDSTLYAVEFTGAPFRPGYAGGSVAPKAASPVDAATVTAPAAGGADGVSGASAPSAN